MPREAHTDEESHLMLDLGAAEAQVARLEAELRWCIRGLEDAANARPEHLVDWVANLNLERLEYARAALSPDAGKGPNTKLKEYLALDGYGVAGKGWLPPEVGEQVRETLQAWFDWENDGTGQADTRDYDEEGAKHLQLLMANTRATLDVLKGVE